MSAERELVDSNTCKSTRPCFRHSWTQGPKKCYQTCFSPLVSFPFSFAFASLMLKPWWSLDSPGSQSGGSERVQGAGSGAGLQSVLILSPSSLVILRKLLNLVLQFAGL